MADDNVIDAPKPEAKDPETFSKDYVRELRAENKGYRIKLDESTRKMAETDATVLKAQQDADAKIAEASTASQQRIIRAELKASAIKAGMVDLDGLKLADMSTVKLDEAGEVIGADELMESLKKAKPYLFGAPDTSSTHKAPEVTPPEAKMATDIKDPKEYAKFKADMLKKAK
jgi:hypothetical protein